MGPRAKYSTGFFWSEVSSMAKVMFFIDGFNVYHSLKDDLKYHKYLWLDFSALAQRFTRRQDTISGVYYFSSYATWKPHSMKRHTMLIDALKSRGVGVVMGKFKEKDRYCKKCGATFKAREEKQTDVNIAVYLFKEALANSYDTAIIMTNDTDLVPAIEGLKSVYPWKKVGVLFPIDRWAKELTDVCDFWRKVEKKDLSKSQFPNQVLIPINVILTRPKSWK